MSGLSLILTNVRVGLTSYLYCPLFVLGNIGNVLNILVFSQKSMRTSVCSIYFLIVSIANLLSINIGYLTRILPTLGVPDPSRNVEWYCKGRAYISGFSLTLARHFLCVITIDRFLVTSTQVAVRQLSSMKLVKWLVPTSCISWAIFYIHTLIGYETTRGGTSCGRQAGFYSTFTTVCTISIDAILPIVTMMTFNLLMLKNINGLRLIREKTSTQPQLVRAVPEVGMPTNGRANNNGRFQHQGMQRIEKQLTRLSFIQVFIYVIFNLPNAAYVVYMLIATNDSKTADRVAIESFVSIFFSILTFIYCTVSIYKSKISF